MKREDYTRFHDMLCKMGYLGYNVRFSWTGWDVTSPEGQVLALDGEYKPVGANGWYQRGRQKIVVNQLNDFLIQILKGRSNRTTTT